MAGAGSVGGLLASVSPGVAIWLASACLISPIVVSSPTGRLIMVAGGALLVFQSDADTAKFGYLSLAVACAAFSAVNLERKRDATLQRFRPMMWSSFGVLAMLALSALNAETVGTDPANWVRDMLPYFLMVVLPLIGLDAAGHASPRLLIGLGGALGVVAALGFAVDWLNRRDATDAVGRIILATATLPVLAFCLALAQIATRSAHRLRWMAVLIAVPVALLITGSRTYLVVLAAAALGVTGAAAMGRVPLHRTIRWMVLLGSIAALLLAWIGGGWLSNAAFVESRLAVTASVLTGDFASDRSFQARLIAYDYAAARTAAYPWLGGAPGHIYPTGSFSLDTPWQIPAKFGLLGSIVLVVYFWSIVRSIRQAMVRPAPIYTAGRAWAFSLVALLPFGPWMEDKGTSLALMLFVAAAAATARQQRLNSEDNWATPPSHVGRSHTECRPASLFTRR